MSAVRMQLAVILFAAAALAEDLPNSHVPQPASIAGGGPRFAISFNRQLVARMYVAEWRKKNSRPEGALSDADKNAIRALIREDLLMIYRALAEASEHYRKLGFEPTAAETCEIKESTYHRVWLEDFVGLQGWDRESGERVTGFVRPNKTGGRFDPDCSFHLNLRKLVEFRFSGQSVRMAQTIAHELFHSIQHRYCPGGELWLKESTAAWATNTLYTKDLSHLPHMHLYLLYAHRPLTFDSRGKVRKESDPPLSEEEAKKKSMVYTTLDEDGRPYGAAVFFQFLDAQTKDSAAVVREALRRTSPAVPALTALSGALGDTELCGPAFRALFDRFAVGGLLTDKAPADCAIRGAEYFAGGVGERQRRHNARPRNPVNITSHLHEFLSTKLTDPDTARLEIEFAGDAQQWTERKLTLPAALGSAAGCGVRYWVLKRPESCPKDIPLGALVKAGETEVSLQCLHKKGETWTVLDRAKFSAEAGGHLLRVAPDKFGDGSVVLVLSRYGPDEEQKTFPLTLAAVAPPTVKRLTISQQGRPIAVCEYESVAAADGSITTRKANTSAPNRLDAKGPELKVELEFTSPVKADAAAALCEIQDKPVALQPIGDGTVHTGTLPASALLGVSRLRVRVRAVTDISGSRAAFPIDNDPATVAALQLFDGKWVDYERGPRGHLIEIELNTKSELVIALREFDWKPGQLYSTEMTITGPDLVRYAEADRTGPRHDLVVFAGPSAEGPFESIAGQYTFGEVSRWKNPLKPGDKFSGWLGPDSVQVMPHSYAMEKRDPKTSRVIGGHRGAPFFQAAIVPMKYENDAWRMGDPVVRSNVAAPRGAHIRLVPGMVTAEGKVKPGFGYWGDLRFGLGVDNQSFVYPYAKFKFTFSGQTRYAFNRLDITQGWASVSLPITTRPPESIEVEATRDGVRASRTVALEIDAKKLGDQAASDNKFAQQRRDGKPANLRTHQGYVEDAKKRLEEVRRSNGGNPPAKDLEQAQRSVVFSEQNLVRFNLRFDYELAQTLHDHAAATAALRKCIAWARETYAGDPLRDNQYIRDNHRSEMQTLNSHLSYSAHYAGDYAAFREAMTFLIADEDDQVKAGKTRGPSQAAELRRRLADGIVLFTGEVVEAKALWMEARKMLLESPVETDRNYEKGRWDRGERPDWWPGD